VLQLKRKRARVHEALAQEHNYPLVWDVKSLPLEKVVESQTCLKTYRGLFCLEPGSRETHRFFLYFESTERRISIRFVLLSPYFYFSQ
jgi:hypothetical protein